MPSGHHLDHRHKRALISVIESTMPTFQGRGPQRFDDMTVTASGSAFVAIAVTALVLIYGVPAEVVAGLLITSVATALHGTHIAYRRLRIS
ncbi:hypothetical protein [Streptomyces clavifer]|uniref:hypothetical protein n=1 Tax=Streptomyces clavifer TaxID=68188 RepID=UPI00364C12F4